MKKARKSRTIWLGGAVSTLGVLQALVVSFPIPPIWQGVSAIIIGLLIILLRLDTDGPIQ